MITPPPTLSPFPMPAFVTSTDESILSHHIDLISLKLAPYCCGPGESFTLEPIRDNGTYTHDNTYLWLDMTWERLRGHAQRESVRLIHALCVEALPGAVMRRIVLMTGQAPAPVVKVVSVPPGADQTPQPAHFKSPPLIEFMHARAQDSLPLLPAQYAGPNQEDMVPVTRCLKNGTDVIYGWRKANGPLVISFDPIMASDNTQNRNRRIQRKNGLSTVAGSKAKVAHEGGHRGKRSGTKRDKSSGKRASKVA